MRIVRVGTVAAAVLAAGSAFAWEGPKRTVDPAAAPVRRTWADVKASIAASIDRTAYGYFAYSHAFNDIGPIDTSGTLTDEELRTQFAMACVLASPITVKGPVPAAVTRWLADGMLMNVNDDKVARQGHVVMERDGTFVVLKYLWGMNGAHNAVAFYNPTDEARRFAVCAGDLSLSGEVSWTDRFDTTKSGLFDGEFVLDVPAHGARLLYMSGTPTMRREYRRECAFRSPGRLTWRDVFVPKDGVYALRIVTTGTHRPAVRVNGLSVTDVKGDGTAEVRLFAPENVVDLTGEGTDDVLAIRLAVPSAPKEPEMSSWGFVEELKAPERNPAPAAGTRPGDLKAPWLTNRISRCYFSPIKRAPYFRDELTDDIDYYPDAYLERLRNEGVNGLWISSEFRELAETSFNRRDAKGLRRLEKLAKVVAKCKRHGIKVWLFGIEPKCFSPDDPLLKAHPEFAGSRVDWADYVMMCPSEPHVLQFLEEQTHDIFSHVPDLAGLLMITNGEGMMTCLSCRHVTGEEPYREYFTCERCRNRPNWQLHTDTVSAMLKGMRRVNPKAEILSWFYQAAATTNRLEWVREAARHLPEGVSLIYNFESGGLTRQAGRLHCAGDYWLSYPGPGVPFQGVAAAAKGAGTRVGAKIQTANSHECATVPYVPAPGLLYRKMKAMRAAGVSDVMMCWFFGNYPGLMNRVVGELSYSDFRETEDEYLEHLARQVWGEDAKVMGGLWRDFTDGYSSYPFSNHIQYYGPFHNGLAWPLLTRVECDRLSHTWVPGETPSGDMVCEALCDFTIDEAISLSDEMARKCSGLDANGVDLLEALSRKYAGDRERLNDLGVMKTLRALFRSGADVFRFYRLRSEAIYQSRVRGDAAAAVAAVRRMRGIVRSEKSNTAAVIPLAKADSRLGFHSEAQDYKFWPELLEWRLARLDESLADLDIVEAVVARGEGYPESALERTAPRVSVGGAPVVTTNVTFGLVRRTNGDLVVTGRAKAHLKNLVLGAFDAACVRHPTHAFVPRPDLGEKVVCFPAKTTAMDARAKMAENGEWTFEVVFRAAAWNGDDRLRPGWFALATDAMPQTLDGSWIWPESADKVRCRLLLPWLWGRNFGRIVWADPS